MSDESEPANNLRARRHRRALPARLIHFFEQNPDEELTVGFIAVKFDASPTAVHNAVKRLAEAGFLETLRVIRRPAKGRA